MRGIKSLIQKSAPGKLAGSGKFACFRARSVSTNRPVGPKLKGITKLLTKRVYSSVRPPSVGGWRGGALGGGARGAVARGLHARQRALLGPPAAAAHHGRRAEPHLLPRRPCTPYAAQASNPRLADPRQICYSHARAVPCTVDHERVGSFYNPLHRAARHREGAAAAPATTLPVRARANSRELRSAGAVGMTDDGKPHGGGSGGGSGGSAGLHQHSAAAAAVAPRRVWITGAGENARSRVLQVKAPPGEPRHSCRLGGMCPWWQGLRLGPMGGVAWAHGPGSISFLGPHYHAPYLPLHPLRPRPTRSSGTKVTIRWHSHSSTLWGSGHTHLLNRTSPPPCYSP